MSQESSATRQVRGQLWGSHCFACGARFTDDDRPVYTGRYAMIAATGYSTVCRACREHRRVLPPRSAPMVEHGEAFGRSSRTLVGLLMEALRIPNLPRRLGLVPKKPKNRESA